jgi:hypothetical protein
MKNARSSLVRRAFALLAGLTIAGSASAATFRVEIDYMGDGGGHDHMPSQEVLDAVIQMFACQGHTLIIDLDDEVPHAETLIGDPTDDCGSFWTYTGAANTYATYRNLYRDRGEGWHYCLFAHQYSIDSNDVDDGSGCVESGSSGRANGGDAFIVTLGNFFGDTGTPFQQAATLAHELGHNLGLSHSGSMDTATVSPYVQNLPSVMSYTYQLGGVRNTLLELEFAPDYALFKNIDYSHGRMCTLNENSLDEIRGTRMRSVDFDCDGVADGSGIQQDLGFRGNGSGALAPWCGQPNNSLTMLTDYNEWANLEDGAALVAAATRAHTGDLTAVAAAEKLAKRERMLTPCITADEWRVMESYLGDRGAPTLEIEPCITGENVYVAPLLSTFPTGTCRAWYMTISSAEASSPDDSVYYLTPGIYEAAGMTVLSKPGIWTCNTGTAVIR